MGMALLGILVITATLLFVVGGVARLTLGP
jgi:hypothetical protein